MNREEALKRTSRAQIGIVVGMAALIWASLNATRAIRYLQGVVPSDRIISVSDQEPKDTKKALENMVETYYESVN